LQHQTATMDLRVFDASLV